MPAAPHAPFNPPTPEQFETYLRDHPANPPTVWQMRTPWIVAIVLIVLSFVTGGPLSAVLPWIALIWLLGHTSFRTRRMLSLQSRVRRTQEIAMLRRPPKALRLGWRILPQVAPFPQLHGQTIAMISHCLDSLGQYDAAIVGYDYLLTQLPPGQPITVHIGVSRAAAALGAERLSDADDAIRRLRGPVEPFNNTPISAAYRLAMLAQQVRTHHFEAGVQESEGLADALRPLGVDAGYGHALMALCHYRTDTNTFEDNTFSAATRSWWRQATLLLPPSTLLKRYPELQPLMELS